jgi:hypothetical protein
MASGVYEQHLESNAANFVALSPTSFVERSAEVFRRPARRRPRPAALHVGASA